MIGEVSPAQTNGTLYAKKYAGTILSGQGDSGKSPARN
jgi:hypothetical protein